MLLTAQHLRIAAEAANHWPATVNGNQAILHDDGKPIKDVDDRWYRWFEFGSGHGTAPPLAYRG